MLSLVFSLAYAQLITRQAPFRTQEDNRYAELCNTCVSSVLGIALLLEIDSYLTQMEGLANDPGLKMRLQGYGGDTLAIALIVLVCAAFAMWAWLVRGDIATAQEEQVIRYDDGTLASIAVRVGRTKLIDNVLL